MVLLLSLAGCRYTGEWKDDGMEPEVKAAITSRNKDVMEAIMKGDVKKFHDLGSETFFKTSKVVLKDWLSEAAGKIKPEAFRIRNQFYVKMVHAGIVDVGSESKSFNDYRIRFKSNVRDNVITVGYFQDSLYSYSMTTVFGLYGKEWKLDMIRIGRYLMFGRDAMSWYQQAEDEYTSGDDIDAVNHFELCRQTLDTDQQLIRYVRERDALDFGINLKQHLDATYKMPMTDTEVSTRPLLFSITQKIVDGKSYPLVAYKTMLPFADTTKQSRECDEVHSTLAFIFKGVDKNEAIYYRAFATIPEKEHPDLPSHLFLRRTR